MNVRLADIADIIVGAPFRSRIESEAEGAVAVVQARDLSDNGRIDLVGAARLRDVPGSATRLLSGDVVMQPRGIRFPVGLFEESERPAIAAAPLLVIRYDRSWIDPEFLAIYLQSPSTQAVLRQSAVGTHVPQVPRQAIGNLVIHLPALANQRRLVDLVCLERREAELMVRLRDLRARLFESAVRELANKNGGCASAQSIQGRI